MLSKQDSFIGFFSPGETILLNMLSDQPEAARLDDLRLKFQPRKPQALKLQVSLRDEENLAKLASNSI